MKVQTIFGLPIAPNKPDPRLDEFLVSQVAFNPPNCQGADNKSAISTWLKQLHGSLSTRFQQEDCKCILLRRNYEKQASAIFPTKTALRVPWDTQRGRFTELPNRRTFTARQALSEMIRLDDAPSIVADEFNIPGQDKASKLLAITHQDIAKLDKFFENIRSYSFPRVLNLGPGDNGWRTDGGNFVTDVYRTAYPALTQPAPIQMTEWHTYEELMQGNPYNQLFDPFML